MGDERASDNGDEDNECDLSHAFLSEENDVSVGFYNDNVCFFCPFFVLYRLMSLHAGFVDGNVRQKGSIDDFSMSGYYCLYNGGDDRTGRTRAYVADA